jgi:hypothetical protein
MTLFDEDCSKYTEFKMTLFIIETTTTIIISLALSYLRICKSKITRIIIVC